jgi:hypothetical protein
MEKLLALPSRAHATRLVTVANGAGCPRPRVSGGVGVCSGIMNPIGLLQALDLVEHVGLHVGEHRRLELFKATPYAMRPAR